MFFFVLFFSCPFMLSVVLVLHQYWDSSIGNLNLGGVGLKRND